MLEINVSFKIATNCRIIILTKASPGLGFDSKNGKLFDKLNSIYSLLFIAYGFAII